MKRYLLLCSLLFLWAGASLTAAEEVAKADVKPVASSVDKEALKKLPRLGMTLDQLRVLWGEPERPSGLIRISGNVDELRENEPVFWSWKKIGNVNIKAFFQRLYDEDGQDVHPSVIPNESIEFSYHSHKVPLKFSQIMGIAEALLPGYKFERAQSDDKEWELGDKVLCSTDKDHTYSLRRREDKKFLIYFTKPRELKSPELKATIYLDKI